MRIYGANYATAATTEPAGPEIDRFLRSHIHFGDTARSTYQTLTDRARQGLYLLRLAGVSPRQLDSMLSNHAYTALARTSQLGVNRYLELVRDLHDAGVHNLDYGFEAHDDVTPLLSPMERVVSGIHAEYEVALHTALLDPEAHVSLGGRWTSSTDSSSVDVTVRHGSNPQKVRIVESKSSRNHAFIPDTEEQERILSQARRLAEIVQHNQLEGLEYVFHCDCVDSHFLKLLEETLRATGSPFIIRIDRGGVLAQHNLEPLTRRIASLPARQGRALPPIPSGRPKAAGNTEIKDDIPILRTAPISKPELEYIRKRHNRQKLEVEISPNLLSIQEELTTKLQLADSLTYRPSPEEKAILMPETNLDLPILHYFKRDISLREIFDVMRLTESLGWNATQLDRLRTLFTLHRQLLTKVAELEKLPERPKEKPRIAWSRDGLLKRLTQTDTDPIAALHRELYPNRPLPPVIRLWADMRLKRDFQPYITQPNELPEPLQQAGDTSKIASVEYHLNRAGLYYPRQIRGRHALSMGLAYLEAQTGQADFHPVELAFLSQQWGTQVQPPEGEKTALTWLSFLDFWQEQGIAGLQNILGLLSYIDPELDTEHPHWLISGRRMAHGNRSTVGLGIEPIKEIRPKDTNRNRFKVELKRENDGWRVLSANGLGASEFAGAINLQSVRDTAPKAAATTVRRNTTPKTSVHPGATPLATAKRMVKVL